MKILVACEYSGEVRDAFSACGHDVISCDFLPSDRPGVHYQGDVLDILYDGYDLLIGFPPCTYLASVGLHWNAKRVGRSQETIKALSFVKTLMNAPIKHICIENPKGCISTRLKKQSQIINPWQFAHIEKKETFLFLKNLPLLQPTKIVSPGERVSFVDLVPDTKDQWKIRSKTFSGVALAMSSQWSDLSSFPIQSQLFN